MQNITLNTRKILKEVRKQAIFRARGVWRRHVREISKYGTAQQNAGEYFFPCEYFNYESSFIFKSKNERKSENNNIIYILNMN